MVGFTIFFTIIALFHFVKSQQKIPPFKNHGKAAEISGVQIGVKENSDELNKYIEVVNRDNRLLNWVGCAGNIASAILSILANFSVN